MDESAERWANLDQKVKALNEEARKEGKGVQYKVFFLGESALAMTTCPRTHADIGQAGMDKDGTTSLQTSTE